MVSGQGFQLCQLRACFDSVQTQKSRQNSTISFSAVVTGNSKNCTINSVGMLRVQNRVIRAQFSNLPLSSLIQWCPDLKKSSIFNRNIFQPYWRVTIRTAPQTGWVCFRCKTESYGPDFQLHFFRWCPIPKKLSKCCPNIFLSYSLETIRIAPKQCWYVWGVKSSHPGLVFKFSCFGTAPVCPYIEKSSKFDQNIFHTY